MSKIQRRLKQIQAKNKTVTDVADELGVSRQTIYKLLEAYEQKGADALKTFNKKQNQKSSNEVSSESLPVENSEAAVKTSGDDVVDTLPPQDIFVSTDEAKVEEVTSLPETMETKQNHTLLLI